MVIVVGSIARCIIFGVPACPSVPVTSGHLQCTDSFAWSRGCPFMTGTTVVHLYHLLTCFSVVITVSERLAR